MDLDSDLLEFSDDDLSEGLDLCMGNIRSMSQLLQVFGCQLQNSKFTHNDTTYTLHFDWTDSPSATEPMANIREKRGSSRPVLIDKGSSKNLVNYFKEKTNSHVLQRVDTLTNMIPKQEEFTMSNEELKRVVRMVKNDEDHHTHLVFWFASPLKPPASIKKQGELKLLDYKAEFKGIEESLAKIHRKIRYSKQVATAASFGKLFTLNPCVLHFSGHGFQVKNQVQHNEGDFLVIEDKYCAGQELSEKKLKHLLEKAELDIKVAVVLSCHSELIGNIFLKAGINHVV